MSRIFEELTEEEMVDENDKRPIPLDWVKEETFEHILLFCEQSGYDDRKEVTRRRLLEKPDALSYEELYAESKDSKDDTIDDKWRKNYFEALTLD